MKFLLAGAGGFIGGHLMKNLNDNNHEVICADIKPLENWYQLSSKNKNFCLDLKN